MDLTGKLWADLAKAEKAALCAATDAKTLKAIKKGAVIA